jgi:hypothetical protein
METTKDTLTSLLAGFPMKWRILYMLGESPVVAVSYPSEEAFRSTLSRTPGGPGMTPEGEELRKAAHGMRNKILGAFPKARVGFEIEHTPAP